MAQKPLRRRSQKSNVPCFLDHHPPSENGSIKKQRPLTRPDALIKKVHLQDRSWATQNAVNKTQLTPVPRLLRNWAPHKHLTPKPRPPNGNSGSAVSFFGNSKFKIQTPNRRGWLVFTKCQPRIQHFGLFWGCVLVLGKTYFQSPQK